MPKRSLSTEAFEAILDRFDLDRGEAWKKYAALRRRIVILSERHSCSPGDDIADEVFARVAKHLLDPQKAQKIRTDKLENFVYGVARKVILEKQIRPSREIPIENGSEVLPLKAPISSNPEHKLIVAERKECYKNCIHGLPKGYRDILKAFYDLKESGESNESIHRTLAKKFKMKESSSRSKVSRAKEMWLECVKKSCLDKELSDNDK